MSNTTNLPNNSQLSPLDSERKMILDTLHRLNEEELVTVKYAYLVQRGIGNPEVTKVTGYSDSAASCLLRRLTEPEYNKRLITSLMTRSKCGPKSSFLYFLRKEVMLEDIELTMNERGFDYERFLVQRSSKNKSASSSTKEDNQQVNTSVPSPSITSQTMLENASQHSVSNQEQNGGSPLLIAFKKALAERDAQIQQLKQEVALLRQEQQELAQSFLGS